MQRFVQLIGAGSICNSTCWGQAAISGLANGLLYEKKKSYLIRKRKTNNISLVYCKDELKS